MWVSKAWPCGGQSRDGSLECVGLLGVCIARVHMRASVLGGSYGQPVGCEAQ